MRPTATRGPGLSLVPSQKTERIQANEVPDIWPAPKRDWHATIIFIIGLVLLAASIGLILIGGPENL